MARDRLAVLGERGAEDVGARGERRVVHRDLDVVALSGALARKQRHQNAREAVQRDGEVGERQAGDGRLAILAERHAEDAAQRLDREVVRRPLAQRAVAAEGADRAIDKARVALAQRVVGDAKPLDDAGPERLDEDIRGVDEAKQRRVVLCVLQVEHQAFLAAVEIPEVHRARSIREAKVSRRVAFARRLDLDHFGAVIGEREGEIGPGEEKREVEHPQSCQLHIFFRR